MFKNAHFVQLIATEFNEGVNEKENAMSIITIYLNKIKKIDHIFIMPPQIRDT
jgi:hypothetical protein